MGRLKAKKTSHIYTQVYKQRGGSSSFPVYRGKRGGNFLGRIIGPLISKVIRPLARPVLRTLLPQAKHVLKPMAKEFGKKMLAHGVNEYGDVLTGKKKFKDATRNMVKSARGEMGRAVVKKMQGGKRKNVTKLKSVNPKKPDIFASIHKIK